MRTPTQIQRFLDDHQHTMDLGIQYLGDEPNARRKPWDTATVRWLLAASWPYEAAAGNSSIPAVYKTINDADDSYLCDRFYLPATPRDLKLLEKNRIPVFGIESKQPLTAFDVVGSSISYPVLSMSYVKLLTMSGLAPRWRDRDPNTSPMIICGGQSYGAPEVLAPVVDAWWCGEVEDEPGNPGMADVCARITLFKQAGLWAGERLGCYADLAREFPFLYFPRFVTVHYGHEDRGLAELSKQVVGYSSTVTGMRTPIVRRYVKDLDNATPLTDPPLLYADPAMGSGDLEVARGCPAWCSFCQLAYTTKPYRQRTTSAVVDYAKAFHDNMGSVRMAPFSPDFPMYTQRKRLIRGLLENVSDEVDAPAMRVDDFIGDSDFILLQVHGGMDSLTLGVEGNSQRMRDLVGKGTSDADIREAVARGVRAGIRKFKLFMISNLPGEDEGDVLHILRLAKDLADIRDSMNQPNVRIQFSWTPLMIEAGTPFQWFAPHLASRVLGDIWEEFRDLKVDFKLGSKAEINKAAYFQLSQRASRHVGEALVDAMVEVNQACWGGVPRTFKDLIEDKLIARGFANGYGDCFDERFEHDMFGWEFIDRGVAHSLLWTTYRQMVEFIEHTDSRTYDRHFDDTYRGAEWVERCDSRCSGKRCGACDYTDLKIRTRYLRSEDTVPDLVTVKPVDQRSQAMRIRARITKPERYRLIGNDHWRYTVRRAAFRAQTDLGWEHGIAKRSITFASDEARTRDWTCGTDYVEIAFTRKHDREHLHQFLTTMNTHLDPWLAIGDWIIHPATSTSIRADADLNLYELEIDTDPSTALIRLQQWAGASHVPMRLRVDAGYFAPATEEVNARDYVDDVWLIRDGARLKLRMLVRGRPSPYNVYAAFTRRTSWLDVAGRPAVRLETFIASDREQQDFVRPNCVDCGWQIPVTVLDRPYDPHRCPHCRDTHTGIDMKEMTLV